MIKARKSPENNLLWCCASAHSDWPEEMRHTRATSPAWTLCGCRGYCCDCSFLQVTPNCKQTLPNTAGNDSPVGKEEMLASMTRRKTLCFVTLSKSSHVPSTGPCREHSALRGLVWEERRKSSNQDTAEGCISSFPTSYAGDLTQAVISLLDLSNPVIKQV